MKKIMILNGSPRKTGNTAALIEAFARGAQEAGNEVTSFFLNGMNIHGCLGCFGGGKDPASPCVQKDDMLKIYPLIARRTSSCLPRPYTIGRSADSSKRRLTACLPSRNVTLTITTRKRRAYC